MAKKQSITISAGVLTCAYPTIGKTLTRKLSDYPKGIYVACDAADHGIKQKFGDAESGGDPAEKYAEVLLIDESLLAGEWTRAAKPVDRTPLILQAVATLKGLKFDLARGTLSDGKKVMKPTEEQVKQWARADEVKVELARQNLEKARKAAEDSKGSIEVKFA